MSQIITKVEKAGTVVKVYVESTVNNRYIFEFEALVEGYAALLEETVNRKIATLNAKQAAEITEARREGYLQGWEDKTKRRKKRYL